MVEAWRKCLNTKLNAFNTVCTLLSDDSVRFELMVQNTRKCTVVNYER